jgi:hypothetical protein
MSDVERRFFNFCSVPDIGPVACTALTQQRLFYTSPTR